MVKHCATQKNDASVRFLPPDAILYDQTQHEARISWVRLFHCLGTVFVNESTNNKLRMRERVEWMVCHSERVSSSEATTCNHQFSESEWWRCFTKRIWMHRFGKLPSVSNCVCLYCTAPPVLCSIILQCNTRIEL